MKLDKLDAVLAQTSTPIQGRGTSLPRCFRCRMMGDTPRSNLWLRKQRRQRTLGSFNGTTRGTLARRSDPALMIVEDAHWADPTSLEVFGHGRWTRS